MPSFVSGRTCSCLRASAALLVTLAIAPAALNGDLHVTISSTQSGAGYRMNNHINSQLSGTSITTGTKYVNSDDQDDAWFAGAPFPTVHTHTYDFDLLSQGATANYVLHVTMHETVNAMGVPTAAVDQYRMDCRG